MYTDTRVLSSGQFKPPPRRVKFRGIEVMAEVWFWRVALLAAAVIPFFIWWIILEPALIWTLGKDVTARIESVRPAYRKGGGPDRESFDLGYSFDIGGGQREVGYGKINMHGAAAPKEGEAVAVKVLYIWPRYRSQLKEHEGFLAVSCCIGTFATPFTVAWLIGNLIVWLPALRERRIMRRGTLVVGEVAQKVVAQKVEEKGNCIVWYRFGAADGQTWGDKAEVSRKMYDELQQGEHVLVVYLAHRPRASLLYEASRYRAR